MSRMMTMMTSNAPTIKPGDPAWCLASWAERLAHAERCGQFSLPCRGKAALTVRRVGTEDAPLNHLWRAFLWAIVNDNVPHASALWLGIGLQSYGILPLV